MSTIWLASWSVCLCSDGVTQGQTVAQYQCTRLDLFKTLFHACITFKVISSHISDVTLTLAGLMSRFNAFK